MRLGNNSTKGGKNEVKIKNQSTFFKINNFKNLKKTLVYNKIIHDNFTKKPLSNQWDQTLVRLSHRNGLKTHKAQKFSKNLQKHKLLKPL